MSHRPEDNYGFVATQTISFGTVIAFNVGDPVPDSTVDENPAWVEDGLVVRRSEWNNRPQDEPERPLERGEMPPHLRDKTAEDADSATAQTVAAGGSSRRTPTPTKSGTSKAADKNT